MRPFWLIHGRYMGADDWDAEPLHHPDGRPVWFRSRKEADAYAIRLTDREADLFAERYGSVWQADAQPCEYEAFKAWTPVGPDAGSDGSADTLPLTGGSSREPAARRPEPPMEPGEYETWTADGGLLLLTVMRDGDRLAYLFDTWDSTGRPVRVLTTHDFDEAAGRLHPIGFRPIRKGTTV